MLPSGRAVWQQIPRFISVTPKRSYPIPPVPPVPFILLMDDKLKKVVLGKYLMLQTINQRGEDDIWSQSELASTVKYAQYVAYLVRTGNRKIPLQLHLHLLRGTF